MRSKLPRGVVLLVALGALGALGATSPIARAQAAPMRCPVLCAPTLTLMPAVIRSHLFGGPLVRDVATGATHRLPAATNMEIIIATAARTALPRLSAFASVQWLPNASEGRNPFTQYTAADLGGHVHANAPTATFGLSAAAVTATETHGWVDADANVGDLYSQAARPGDRASYTHKLDLELVTHWHAFAWTPRQTYVHRAALFALLDYLASGLPRAGDEVPKGRRFLEHARPIALIAGLTLPITPEVK
jgi:hypothetical protein